MGLKGKECEEKGGKRVVEGEILEGEREMSEVEDIMEVVQSWSAAKGHN